MSLQLIPNELQQQHEDLVRKIASDRRRDVVHLDPIEQLPIPTSAFSVATAGNWNYGYPR